MMCIFIIILKSQKIRVIDIEISCMLFYFNFNLEYRTWLKLIIYYHLFVHMIYIYFTFDKKKLRKKK